MLMDLNCKAIFFVFVSFIQHFQGFAWTSKRKSCPRTTDSLFYNMQAVMMWMCSHWLWMRNVYLFRINFAKVFRRIRISAHKNIISFFLTGWYFRNQILVENRCYNFTSFILQLWMCNVYLFRINFAKVFRSSSLNTNYILI